MQSIGRSGWLILVAALLPLLLFAIFQFGFSAREQRRSLESSALARSEAVILAADGQVERVVAGTEALATSRSVLQRDAVAFRSRAAQLTELYGTWAGAQLVDRRSGRVIAQVGSRPSRMQRVAATSDATRTLFVGYGWGDGCPCLVFERLADGRGSPLLIRILVKPEPFLRLLPPPSNYPVSAIAGPKGRFIARSLHQSERFGQLASTYLRGAVFGGKESGIYRGFTLEGLENYTAYSRSRVTGWTAHVALPISYFDAPSRTFFSSLGLAALVSLLLAGLLVVFAIRQITEGRRIAERMQQAQKLEALGQLTGGIAHDFNNLLTPIVGALDWLRRSPDVPPRSQRLAGGALASAERASKLTAQLLAFSRRQKLQMTSIHVGTLLDELTPLLEQTVGKTHRLQVDVAEDVRCLRSDPNQLEVAILNLALNARDATPEGSLIEVRARAVAGDGDLPDVLIEVADAGSGMDEETRQRALEPFFTTKEPGKGTGLGLAQVFALAQQSGGEVTIESEVGVGTTVRLRLPGSAEEAVPLNGEAASPWADGQGRQLRLLVVDDDPAVRSVIARTLEDVGHDVDAVASGRTALAALEAEGFDLIVTDYAMPEMDGAELIRRARELRPDSRFLLVTGYADTEAVQAACPDTTQLFKPFTPEALLTAVKKLTVA